MIDVEDVKDGFEYKFVDDIDDGEGNTGKILCIDDGVIFSKTKSSHTLTTIDYFIKNAIKLEDHLSE